MIPPSLPKPTVAEPLLGTLIGAAALAFAGDFLMWDHRPGLGVAIFTALLGILMLVRGSRSKRAWIAFVLLISSCVQGAIGFCLTNVCVTLLLLCVLLAESHYAILPAGWARWLEGILAWMKAPGRWIWLIGECSDSSRWSGLDVTQSGPSLVRAVRIGMPAVVLLGIFTAVLANGNAVLSHEINLGTKRLIDWLLGWDFSLGRLFFFGFIGTLALVAARPAGPATEPRALATVPVAWVRSEPNIAFWQSALVLGSLNLLFLVVNTLDAIFLWMHGTIPEGVIMYDYIHSGTNSLITATVLSAFVLTVIFHQQREIVRRGFLRGMAHLWIAQNLLLVASVWLRLKMYYDSSHLLTDTRIHLALFLMLVTLGFGFLVAHIERGPNLRLLLWRNACSAFVLLYVIQFVNTVGLSARWNVHVWATTPGWGIDLDYLRRQGPDAWPALIQLATGTSAADTKVKLAALAVRESAAEARKRLSKEDWREFQFRYRAHARQVIEADEKL